MKLEAHELRENTLRRELETVMELAPHDPLDWHLKALCAYQTWSETDSDKQREVADIWFSEVGRNTRSRVQTPGEAKAADICWTCPVRKECLKYACDTTQEHGTWGGLPTRMIVDGKHDFESLVEEPNPFDTTDVDSRFYRPRLQSGSGRPRKFSNAKEAA